MAKMARKSVTKRTTNPPLATVSSSEQKTLNEDFFTVHGVKPTSDVQVTKEFYDEWGGKGSSVPTNEKRGGWSKSGFGVDYPSENKEVGKLPIRKITSSAPRTTIQKAKYNAPIEVKYKKETKVKALSKGGKPLQRLATNVKATAKNIVGPAKFKREEKLAGAYERQKVNLTGETSKEKIAQLKGDRKYLRSKEMRKTGQGTTLKSKMERAKTLSGARKDLRQAEKYVKKEAKGKIKYFTQDAMNKKEQLTLDEMKKRKSTNQAGKTRYSS